MVMNEMPAATALRVQGAAGVFAGWSALTANRLFLPSLVQNPHLPLAGSQSGNVFRDATTPTLAWYLPGFALADDLDAAFAFTAAKLRGQVDSNGNVFATATLTIGVETVVPADVVAYEKKNPTIEVRPIPITGLAATLTLVSFDATTAVKTPRTITGVFVPGPQGRVIFTAVVGTSVIIGYENLMGGGASLTLTGSYSVVRPVVVRVPQGGPPPPVHPTLPPVHPTPAMPLRPEARGALVGPPPSPQLPVPPPHPVPHPLPHPVPPIPHPVTEYVQSIQPLAVQLALDSKFAGPGYAPRYTVSDGTTTRVVASVDDLKGFGGSQSEFSEFTALGDVAIKYPSFSRLYIGALSRVVVAIPAQYGIVRGSHGTAAVCQALLDASATGSGACKFQFSFAVGGAISPIDLVALTRDVAASTAAHDCAVVLPSQLDPKGGSSLTTLFQDAVSFDVGTAPGTFQVSVTITDRDASLPAVAVANQFIGQLVQAIPPFLTGKIRLRLDDDYPTPLEAPVVLNFQVTCGSDEITVDTNATAGLALQNASPLDLQVQRYALASKQALEIVNAPQPLPAEQRIVLSPTTLAADTQLLVDRSLSLALPLTKADTAHYLQFNVSDVQSVQYQVGVSAAGVDFKALHIARIDVVVTLTDLPQITVPGFSLGALDSSSTEQIFLPIASAIGSLKGVASLTVHSVDANVVPVSFSVPNDFMAQPLVTLTGAVIPPFPPPTAPAASDPTAGAGASTATGGNPSSTPSTGPTPVSPAPSPPDPDPTTTPPATGSSSS